MYIIPIGIESIRISSHMARTSNGSYHQGLDLVSFSEIAPNVIAAEAGVVSQVDFDADGYGNFAVVQHANDEYTLYGHMAEPAVVSAGANVSQGQLIGAMGSTGNSSGRHLHFEIVVPPKPNDFWSSVPRWQFKKNPFLEVPAFSAASFGGQAEQAHQARRWIDAIVAGPASGLSRSTVIDKMVGSKTLAAALVPIVT
jgi:murein DD-endopeptidase MepM/ murein hydrolase activator NlpD